MSVNALGYCEDEFNPADPGRLCRGQERWIESYPDEEQEPIYRVVISGAAFSDDSAGDARRGLCYSGSSAAELISTLFPGKDLHAWAEESLPAAVPPGAQSVETYTVTQPGGPLRRWTARWTLPCPDQDALHTALDAGADVIVVLSDDKEDPQPLGPPVDPAFAPVPPLADAPDPIESCLSEGLRQRLHLLTGFRQGVVSSRRFQAGVLPELLKSVKAIVLIHSDKHGRCLGIYSTEEVRVRASLETLREGREMLVVPFAIPPMLARWDRALWEMRQDWDEEEDGPFPVSEAPEGVQSWGRRQSNRA